MRLLLDGRNQDAAYNGVSLKGLSPYKALAFLLAVSRDTLRTLGDGLTI